MPICATCGRENPDGFRFCGSCGAALAEAAPRETRKTVTVLFCDLTGSTALGESLDPEALRATMRSYHAELRTILERHGGTVEKFVGDAVMAVFGIPQAHEDDALRAVRAATEMRDAVAALGLEARIGVNTGEVVAGEGETLVTGDAVNVAARLEQRAEPGQILIGAATQALVRDAVSVEPLELELKGKSDRVAAFRLVDVDHAAPAFARRPDAPLVGRERELRTLREAFERVANDRACHLFTLLGPAGVGKSRLVAEFLRDADAQVLRGRCLHYGEGITFWPLVEILKELGERGEGTLERVVEGEAASSEALFWDVRKLFESVARERPLVLQFDDLHWAEPTFLDLLDHVADLSRDAPILLLCLARPELLDDRPGWGGGKLNATTALLEPLTSDESRELVAELGGLDEQGVARVVEAAEGNPLFLEEMVALMDEGGEVTVPPTIQALLAERLDRLGTDERAVMERGAVEGQVFHRGAVAELAPPPPAEAIDGHLVALVRKELVRPAEPVFADDDAFRFRHLLIRDAAYDSLPKELRSELHARFADWLERRGGLVELDELVGYHLEQAASYRRELGQDGGGLAARAGGHLGAAGLRAAARGDFAGSRNLLERAVELLPDEDAERASFLTGLSWALENLGAFAEAEPRASQAIDAARALGDRVTELQAVLRRVEVRLYSETASFFEGRAEAEAALAELERLDDDRALAEALLLVGKSRSWVGDIGGAQEALARSIERAHSSGDQRIVAEGCGWLSWAILIGPQPVDEGLVRIAELRERFGDNPVAELWFQIVEAGLEGMRGRSDAAAALLDAAVARADDFGMAFMGAASMAEIGYYLERVADRPAELERRVRIGYEQLAAMGEKGMLSTRAAFLGDAVYRLGQLDEAESLAREADELGSTDDRMTASASRAVRAKVLARRGDREEAERLIREAVGIVERTQWLEHHARLVEDLGEVLTLVGKPEEAAEAFGHAAELYERKGMLTAAERLRAS